MLLEKYSLIDIIENHKRLKNLPLYTIFDYLEESTKDKKLFTMFLQILSNYYPHIFNVVRKSVNNNIVPLKLIFQKELMTAPRHVKNTNSQINFYHLIKTLEEYISSGNLANLYFRKTIIDNAVELLSNEEYEAFIRIISQKTSDKIAELFEELYKDNNLPEEYAKEFLFYYDKESFVNKHENYSIFDNYNNSEFICHSNVPLRKILISENMFFEMNNKFTPIKVIETSDAIYEEILAHKKANNLTNGILITDFMNIYGIINRYGFFCNMESKSYKKIIESKLSDIITSDIDTIFILDKYGKVMYSFTKEKGDLLPVYVKIKNFTTMDCPFTGGKYDIMNVLTEDEKNISLIAKKEIVANIGKKKNISFINFNNTNYLI